MSRDIDSDTQAALLDQRLTPIGFVEMEFSAAVRLWSGIGTYTWDGYDWAGVGALGRISAIEETVEVRAVGVTLELSGINSAAVNDAGDTLLDVVKNETWQGRGVTIWYAVLEGRNPVGEPVQLFSGRMDTMEIVEGAETAIRIGCESIQIDLERTKVRRWTSADQRAEYPDDAGLDYVSALQDVSIRWGRGE